MWFRGVSAGYDVDDAVDVGDVVSVAVDVVAVDVVGDRGVGWSDSFTCPSPSDL